ncbi:hypothetical protein L2E82_26992 [Cichorium intybus]|uniref:Uncharacterized protein n=1 Tax=Cichorium intybus TaxID=13427 RepID=A0ACB9CS12_CICIN|nr:hypothetical protein L2E82_26992 [Cichorium intybus]
MGFFLLALLSLSIFTIYYVYIKYIRTPLEIQRHFRQQGIGGPSYNPISGNSGELQCLMMAEKKLSSKAESFNNDQVVRMWIVSKSRVSHLVMSLFGKSSLAYLEGEQWTAHRKITMQAFTMEQIKELVPEIVASIKRLLDEIEANIGEENRLELDVFKEFNNLSADVISRIAFGSNFEEGKRVFELQDQLGTIAWEALQIAYVPGSRYLPTKTNRLTRKLQREMKEAITKIIKMNKTSENPKALLSLLMSPYKTKGNVEKRLGFDDIIDEYKTFYLTGKETTANFLTWLFVLLGSHQEWQEKAREEVVRVCGHEELPSAEHLSNFKMIHSCFLHVEHISIILNEALRLYPAAPVSVREASKDLKLGGLMIPAKTQLFLPMIAVHHDRKIWGEDAQKFNYPMRFLEPKKPMGSYFPYGLGPRICVGQHLATVEAKLVLAMILRTYSFVVSSAYVHAPIQIITTRPQYDAPLIFSRVSSL